MTETNKQASENNIAANAGAKTPPYKKPDEVSPPATFHKSIIVASLIISVIALGSSGWLFYQSKQDNTQVTIAALKIQQDSFDAELNTYNKTHLQITKLADQVTQSEQSTKQQTSLLQTQQTEQRKQLQSLGNRIRQINNASKDDWKLAEAEYLIRLANQRLLLESDINGAETLLSNADSILADLEDPIFFEARKAIAKDIQSLKSTNHFDLEGRYLQLSALYDQVNQLPQREPSKKWLAINKKEQANKLEQATAQVGSTFANMWNALKSLVVINYNHKPIKSLLPPAEYQELVTGLQLQIDVAQVALVKGETSIYQKALSRIAHAITDHFDTHSQMVIAFMTSLTALQQVNPAPELPLPRDSLNAMKKLMVEWNTHPTTSTPDTNKETQPKHTTLGESA